MNDGRRDEMDGPMSEEQGTGQSAFAAAGTGMAVPELLWAGDEIAAWFFCEADKEGEHGTGACAVEAEQAPVAARVQATPEAMARRRYLMRYVWAAVGISSVICAAAAARVGMAPRSIASVMRKGPPPSTEVVASPAPVNTAPAPVNAAAAPANATAAAAPATATAESASNTSVTAEKAPSTPPSSDLQPAAPQDESISARQDTPKHDAAAARHEKQVSQRALERGDLSGAIAAGERSLSFDPADAEAWLIVGAAYMQRGSSIEARRSFARCVQLSTRGPREECAALMR